MSETETRAVTLDPKDLKIDWFSGTGKGGQNRNKVQACCRLLHIPSGVSAKAETRSRTSSYDQAYAELEVRVNSLNSSTTGKERAQTRKIQVGTGMRGDKQFSVQLQRNLVVNHTNDRRTTVSNFERGHFDELF